MVAMNIRAGNTTELEYLNGPIPGISLATIGAHPETAGADQGRPSVLVADRVLDSVPAHQTLASDVSSLERPDSRPLATRNFQKGEHPVRSPNSLEADRQCSLETFLVAT